MNFNYQDLSRISINCWVDSRLEAALQESWADKTDNCIEFLDDGSEDDTIVSLHSCNIFI